MPVTTFLIAAGVFGSIGMLTWGAAALVPLVLHLWNRHKHKEAPWAAMEFLLAAVQEQARRMRLEQLFPVAAADGNSDRLGASVGRTTLANAAIHWQFTRLASTAPPPFCFRRVLFHGIPS